jgi:endoglucanase
MRARHFIATSALVVVVPGIMVGVPAFAAEQIVNGTFDSETAPWWATENLMPTMAVVDGRLCTTVPGIEGTTNPWDAIVGINDLKLVKGEGYTFSFTASGDPRGPVRALVQMPVDPYTSYVSATPLALPEGETTTLQFTSPVDRDDAQIVFQVGGGLRPWTLCLDNVSLTGGTEVEAYAADTGPRIRVNQVGYLIDGPKRATLVTDANEPVAWELRGLAGPQEGTIATGVSIPRGMDESAGLNVHLIDFSDARIEWDADYELIADGETSYGFSIGAGVYDSLPYEALQYFYPVRSGIEISADVTHDEAYARPAGHIGVAPNKGDSAVPCQPPESSQKAYGDPWTCDYTLDVTGGWYDAGDHGKYVVNGGISVAQLLAAYERQTRQADPWVYNLRIPEQYDDVPDILDEARWEIDFMLKMVVPDGQPMAGMVHHKVHDSEWTGIPLLPHNDDKVRELHRPSTAATLNLAAVAAHASRLFRPFAEAYAAQLLEAALSAYAAALANPAIFATPEDGNSGGGPYDDTDVSDEFYWAAAELFITTGEGAFLADLKASPHWSSPDVFRAQGFDWKSVQGFARLELALAPEVLPLEDAQMVRQSVLDAADAYLATQAGQPFGHPYAPPENRYDWGSNHLVIQNALVMAAAYDLSGDRKYRDGALEAMDYIFGRNALNLSYVTGYGSVFSQNQHSRWFANQANADLPHPPDGSLAGGPNSSIQDPVAQRLFADQGCAPQTCYVDDIESWSTNEITINWNAALSQMAMWLKDQQPRP